MCATLNGPVGMRDAGWLQDVGCNLNPSRADVILTFLPLCYDWAQTGLQNMHQLLSNLSAGQSEQPGLGVSLVTIIHHCHSAKAST